MKRSISRQLLEPHSPSTEGTITCTICQAGYAPSRLHAYLLQKPPIALESAFISMCHFCFRCRRPSCPNCWDNVHNVCGQCVSETHVPFRLKTPPLEGTPHLPPHSSSPRDERSTPSSLVSVHPGRFHKFPSSSINSLNTWTDHPSAPHVRFPAQSSGTVVVSSPIDIDRIETRPERNDPLDMDKIKTRPDPARSLDIDRVKTHPERNSSLNAPKPETHSTRFSTTKQKLTRILITSALLIVFLIVIGILAAFISVDINLLIANVLHIDVRAELIALWHFLRTFF